MSLETPDYIYSYIGMSMAVQLTTVTLFLSVGSMRLKDISVKERVKTAFILVSVLTLLFTNAFFWGMQNLFWAGNKTVIPFIIPAIFLPIVLGMWMSLSLDRMKQFVDAMPLYLFVGVQYFRVLGAIFLVLWLGGYLPGVFGLPIGLGDLITGVFSVVAAIYIFKEGRMKFGVAKTVSWFGLLDLFAAIILGALSSPGKFHLISLEEPNMLVTAFPVVLISVFTAPMAILLHFLCLWKIHRLKNTAIQPE